MALSLRAAMITTMQQKPSENIYANDCYPGGNISSNPNDNPEVTERRERVFLVLAGFFICCMTLLNVLGITRFVELGPLHLAVGVLPYPLTFLCTDLISEFYGRRRANFVVSLGLALNVFILIFMWVAAQMPSVPDESMPSWQLIQLAESIADPAGRSIDLQVELFQLIYLCTSGAMLASMLAYVIAQYADVKVFHWIKHKTQGKHLWLRNNLSTLTSQLIDSITVISVTFGAALIAGNVGLKAFFILIGSNYLFKMLVALIDTLPLYMLHSYLSTYLDINSHQVR